MIYSDEINYYHALKINGDDLKHFNDYLQKNFTIIEYLMIVHNDSVITTNDVNDVINYENSKFHKLRSLVITVRINEEKDRYFYKDDFMIKIYFGQKQDENIFLKRDITARCEYGLLSAANLDRDQIDKLKLDLKSRIKDLKPWYSFLTRFDLKIIFPVIFSSLVLFGFVMVNTISLFNKLSGKDVVEKQNTSVKLNEMEQAILGVLTFGVVFGIGLFIDLLLSYFFPKVAFDIGKQKRVLQNKITALTWIFSTVIVAFAVNLLAAKFPL